MTPVGAMETPLDSIHQEISQGTWRDYLVKGWNVLKGRNTPCVMAAIKVAATAGSIFTLGFMGSSVVFGSLALAEGLGLMKLGLTASIGGHFGEWLALAFFTGLLAIRFPNALSQLGRYAKIKEVFARTLQDPELTLEEKELIYREELEFLVRESPNFLFETSTFPDTHGIKQFELPGRLRTDIALREVYKEIEQDAKISRLRLFKMGWREIAATKGSCKMVAVTATFIAMSILFGTQYAFYIMGIIWAGVDAADAVRNNELPTIGGHCLEWAAEMAAIGNFSIEIVGEFTNIGKAALVCRLFRERIEANQDPAQKETLKEEMNRQFRLFDEGNFFRIPRGLLYKKGIAVEGEVNSCEKRILE